MGIPVIDSIFIATGTGKCPHCQSSEFTVSYTTRYIADSDTVKITEDSHSTEVTCRKCDKVMING